MGAGAVARVVLRQIVDTLHAGVDGQRVGALQRAGQAARDAIRQRRLDGRPHHRRRRVHLAPAGDPGIGFDADQARVLRAVGGGGDIGQLENYGLDSGDLHGKVPRGGRRIVTDARVRRQARSSGCRFSRIASSSTRSPSSS